MADSTISRVVVSVVDSRGHEFACVRIAGDVGIAAEVEFAAALDQLDALRCANVCVDLAEVSFAGTALLSFLVRVINRVPSDTPVLLCRPSRLTRHLIELSFLDTIATLCDKLPAMHEVENHDVYTIWSA